MRKFLTTVLLASIVGLCFAAGTADKIRWYSGQYTSKTPINNMTVTGLQYVIGMFENGETIKVNDGQKATVSGPNGYTHTPTINSITTKVENGEAVEWAPGFRINCSSSDWSSRKDEGAYNVSFPEAAFTVDGAPNEAFTVTFYVSDNRHYENLDIDFSANPTHAGTYDSLQDIVLTMNNEEDGNRLYGLLGVNPASKVTLSTPAGQQIECAFASTASSPTTLAFKASVPLGTDFSTPGTYTLNIPAGTIRLESQKGSTYYTNNAVVLNYKISGNGSTTSVADRIRWYYGASSANKTPINGSIQALSQLFGMIEDGATVKVLNRPNATVTGPENYSVTSEITQVRARDDETQSTVDQPGFKINAQGSNTSSIKVPGEYTVSIPAGAFTVDGTPCNAFTYSVTVQDTRTYKPFPGKFTVSPNNGVPLESLSYFRLTYNVDNEEGDRIYSTGSVKPGAYGTITKKGGNSTKLDLKSSSDTFGSDRAYRLVFPEGLEFFEDGEYIVNIPAGQMVIGSEQSEDWYTNEELSYTYRIGTGVSTPNYTNTMPVIIPAQGEISALAGVQFESPDTDNFYMELCPQGNTPVKFTVTRPDGTKDEFEPSSSINYLYINTPFNKVYTEGGTYTINVPKGSFKFVDMEGKEWLTNGFDITYNVKGGTLTGMDYTLSTSDNDEFEGSATLYKFDYVYVKFAEEVTPTQMLYSKVVYPDNSVKYARTTWSSANKRFLIDFEFPKQKGTYTVSFPAGAVCNAKGEFNKGFDFTINFIEQNTVDIECTTNPTNGSTVGELYVIYLDAPEGYTEIRPYLGGITKTYFYNNDDRENSKMRYLTTTSTPTRLQIDFTEPIKEVGDYTWELPEETVLGVKPDGTQVIASPMAFFWSIRQGGVVSVGMDKDATYNVYDLNGVSVIRNGSAADLDKLEKGTYIINGKTFIIR